MTAQQKRNRDAAIKNMYYLYQKYYPVLQDEIIHNIEEKTGISFETYMQDKLKEKAAKAS